MKETQIVMGMPVTVEIVDAHATKANIERAFDYFRYVDETFSTYKASSEISQINAGSLEKNRACDDVIYVLEQCDATRQETNGYFDISHNGILDPSGYVKGWAIQNVATLLKEAGFSHYYVEAGGDLQVLGNNADGEPWKIGIRNPFNLDENVKRVALRDRGMATSGTYIRGQHIYNPHQPLESLIEVVSLSVIGPSIIDADRYATAAFAMGREGVGYIASLDSFEGYSIDSEGMATFTDGFSKYVLSA